MRAAAIKPLPSRYVLLLLPIPQGRRAHRTKTTELLNFDVVGSGGLQRGHQRLSRYQLLTRLTTLLGCWLASLLRHERPLIGVELLLSPDVDLILLRSGKHVIQFAVVFYSRHPVLG